MSKRKVKLPLDRNGVPINIDDWLMFDDGPFHVSTLTYYGKGVVAAIGGCWTAEDEDGNTCDNLSAGRVVGRRTNTIYAIGKTRDEAIAAWNRRADE